MTRAQLLRVFYNLQAARLLIDDGECWTSHAMAREDQKSRGIPPRHPAAACWCAAGAIIATDPWNPGSLTQTFNDTLTSVGGMGAVTIYNDIHSHAQVLHWLDIRIKLVARRIDQLA